MAFKRPTQFLMKKRRPDVTWQSLGLDTPDIPKCLWSDYNKIKEIGHGAFGSVDLVQSKTGMPCYELLYMYMYIITAWHSTNK